MNQQQAAMQSMKEWLSHPGELGKEPAKIEPAGEFDLHDLHYYIFRYKKGMFGKWLLGVCGGYGPEDTEHCGMYSARWNHMMLQPLRTKQKKWWR